MPNGNQQNDWASIQMRIPNGGKLRKEKKEILLKKIENAFKEIEFPVDNTKVFFTTDIELDFKGSGKGKTIYANLDGNQFNIRIIMPREPCMHHKEKDIYVYFVAPCIPIILAEGCVVENFSARI